MQELVISQDGGIPFMTKVWSGNASDSVILRERVNAIVEEFSKSSNRYLVADSKLYAEETAKTLNKINFITRVPSTLKLEQSYVSQALELRINGVRQIMDIDYKNSPLTVIVS